MLRINCRHNSRNVQMSLSALGIRIRRVPEEATTLAIRALAEDVAVAIQDIAGGIYWSIESDVDSGAGVARGVVGTPKSRRHDIDSHTPGRPLKFKIDDLWISTYHVNHPGSRPVNWLSRVRRMQRSKQIIRDRLQRAIRGGNPAAPTRGL